MAKPTTGNYCLKQYKCTVCGAVETHGTNHWGEIYPTCKSCGCKHPMEIGQTFVCIEPCPETHDKPEPWNRVTLGDLMEQNDD